MIHIITKVNVNMITNFNSFAQKLMVVCIRNKSYLIVLYEFESILIDKIE